MRIPDAHAHLGGNAHAHRRVTRDGAGAVCKSHLVTHQQRNDGTSIAASSNASGASTSGSNQSALARAQSSTAAAPQALPLAAVPQPPQCSRGSEQHGANREPGAPTAVAADVPPLATPSAPTRPRAARAARQPGAPTLRSQPASSPPTGPSSRSVH